MSVELMAVHLRGHETTCRNAASSLADVLFEGSDGSILVDIDLELIRPAIEGYICDRVVPALFYWELQSELAEGIKRDADFLAFRADHGVFVETWDASEKFIMGFMHENK